MTKTTQPEPQHRISPISRLIDFITRTRTRHRPQPRRETVDLSEALDVLAASRRRYTIKVLATAGLDEPVDLSDLATHVAARENDCSIQEVSSEQYSRVYIALQQQHAPKLDRLDYLQYDHDRKLVSSTPRLVHVWRAYRAFHDELSG